MLRRPTSALLVLAVLTGSGASMRATEEPVGSAIRQTLKEFDSLKATARPEAAGKGRAGMPGLIVIAAPEATVAKPPPVRMQSADERKKAKRSQNWLVDAMMKPERDGSERGTAADDDEATTDDEGLDPLEKLIVEQLRAEDPDDKAHAKAKEFEADDATRLEHAFNPLDNFMAAWISPRDHELLLKAKTGNSDPVVTVLPGRDLPVAALGGSTFASPNERSAPGLTQPIENPYLQLGTPVLPTPPAAPMPEAQFRPESSTPAPTLNPAPVDSRRPADLKAPLPGSLKKAEVDARYFPQLKRF